jgi:hypothetical protein
LNEHALPTSGGVINFAHFQKLIGSHAKEPTAADSICSLSNPDARQLVNTMKKVLLATAAILAFAAPSFAAEPAKEPAKTVGQASPSFYLAQDSATLKCQVVETKPAVGGSMQVVGTAHSTLASAETALKADKTCAKP